MADNDGHRGGFSAAAAPAAQPPSSSASRPTNIALPPRSFGEMMFTGGAPNSAGAFGFGFSPGPMTLVSSFFADGEDCKSFSQLLAGVMSPVAAGSVPSSKPQEEKGSSGEVNRPANLSTAPPPPASMFMAPSGMSPATLLDSPGLGLFSPQGAYGMTHQQALAQVTAQAVQVPSSFSQMSSSTTDSVLHQQIVPSNPNPETAKMEPSSAAYPNQRFQASSLVVDKPADDGYNWRKYGQKQVKGSEYPRSYYKCTHPKCPVTKKVERSLEGQVTEIIYKGQHNHLPPQSNKRAKNSGNLNGVNQATLELASQFQSGNPNKSKGRRDQESSQATGDHLSVTSDSEEDGDTETAMEENDEVEPDAKRRNIEVRVTEPTSSHRTVTEPRIIVQTTSEVDLLDDGYRWRKYGQKVVKGNPYPRSYYKCTTQGCNVRKQVERAASDSKAVITTYEGKHNHDVPAAKNSSHNIANSLNRIASNSQQPIAQLQLKEEQIT